MDAGSILPECGKVWRIAFQAEEQRHELLAEAIDSWLDPDMPMPAIRIYIRKLLGPAAAVSALIWAGEDAQECDYLQFGPVDPRGTEATVPPASWSTIVYADQLLKTLRPYRDMGQLCLRALAVAAQAAPPPPVAVPFLVDIDFTATASYCVLATNEAQATTEAEVAFNTGNIPPFSVHRQRRTMTRPPRALPASQALPKGG